MPHIPARRIESVAALEHRLSGLAQQGGVQDILIIAGEADEQMGPFAETLGILQTGLIDKLGFKHVAVGGHPEGNVAYAGRDVMQVLKDKIAFAEESDAEFRIATQFGFDGPKFVNWAQDVADAGISVPIHLGVAGPAKITTLIKYAAMCGGGQLVEFFQKKNGCHCAACHQAFAGRCGWTDRKRLGRGPRQYQPNPCLSVWRIAGVCGLAVTTRQFSIRD